MKYEGIKQFINTTKTSKSTIYRFYKKNIDLWAETKMKGNKRVYPTEHTRYFSSELMFDENVMLRQENQSMRNLIDCLVDRNSLQCRLWEMDWTFFGAIAYKLERNKKSCYKQIAGLFNHLNNLFGSQTKLRLFFTCEPFTNRTGYHNHFVLYVENNKFQQQVYNEIENYFEFDRVEVKNYDRYKAGIFYNSKEGLNGEDWDYLDNTNQQPESDED
jgi:hypothetical protein